VLNEGLVGSIVGGCFKQCLGSRVKEKGYPTNRLGRGRLKKKNWINLTDKCKREDHERERGEAGRQNEGRRKRGVIGWYSEKETSSDLVHKEALHVSLRGEPVRRGSRQFRGLTQKEYE